MKKILRIAFYGKGGIGKSTIAANVSALFAQSGRKVLHIGCDPKADSTRLLTPKRMPTILQQLTVKRNLQRKDMVANGVFNISCVEAGGPEAGCGCAGLGITTALSELEAAGVLAEPWDVIVYDVLGDVVCGGFSVPMRQHYVDKVYVVTSADYMSLYAANNIFKGICHYSNFSTNLWGGLIVNRVSCENDFKIVQSFAQRTGTKIIAALKSEPQIQFADYLKKLFCIEYPELYSSVALKQALNEILFTSGGKPMPLGTEEMDALGAELAAALYEKVGKFYERGTEA